MELSDSAIRNMAETRIIRRLITETYPKGILSIVSDTFDFWHVISESSRELKPEILARDGKVVFRPDSGDPVDVICGDPKAEPGTPEYMGAVECLWDIFGGTTNSKGFKTLDSHVGLIYGDSITLERADAILSRLAEKGFASDNVVFGIGSYTYQFCTRDTFGMAVKSTYGVVNGEGRMIYKDPVTDTGKLKKSAKGLLKVVKENGKLVMKDQLSEEIGSDPNDIMRLVYSNGVLLKNHTLSEIRDTLANQP